MSWGAQNWSKDAKNPSQRPAMSRKPKLALCGIQRYLYRWIPHKGRLPGALDQNYFLDLGLWAQELNSIQRPKFVFLISKSKVLDEYYNSS
jgi:hypothetical protein